MSVSKESTPLVVDLDGTLVATDTLWESIILAVRNRPLESPAIALNVLGGKARLKAALAEKVLPDPPTLPYREPVLTYLREAKAEGRPIYLVTAADQRIADGVAEHLGLFDEAHGTRDGHNLRSSNKATFLVEQFGEGGFEYLGDSSADLAVWPKAGKAVLVGASKSVEAAAKKSMPDAEVLVPSPSNTLRAMLKAMRPHQWTKNILLFVPVFLSHQYTDVSLMLKVLLAMFCFSLCASSVYVVNDLLDLEQDRLHRTKRKRPFASGALSIPTGLVLSLGCLVVGVGLAVAFLSPSFVAILLGYVAITSVYSVYLKRKLIVDVVTLASLFTYRVIAGVVAANTVFSFWLLSFSMFFFTGLAFAKRYSELRVLKSAKKQSAAGRGYWVQDLEIISSTGPSCGLMAVLVFALYINSEEVLAIYREPRFLWLLCPLLLYWSTRVWFLAAREQLDDDPVVFALKDRISYFAGVVAVVLILLARIGF